MAARRLGAAAPRGEMMMSENLKFWVSDGDDGDIFHEIFAANLRVAVDWARANVRANTGQRIIVALVLNDHGRSRESSEMVAVYQHGQEETRCLSASALAAYEGIDYYAAAPRGEER